MADMQMPVLTMTCAHVMHIDMYTPGALVMGSVMLSAMEWEQLSAMVSALRFQVFQAVEWEHEWEHEWEVPVLGWQVPVWQVPARQVPE